MSESLSRSWAVKPVDTYFSSRATSSHRRAQDMLAITTISSSPASRENSMSNLTSPQTVCCPFCYCSIKTTEHESLKIIHLSLKDDLLPIHEDNYWDESYFRRLIALITI